MDVISEALLSTGKWGEDAIIIGIRAGFKCEYCDKDLLASVDNYKDWQKDHIIPTSKGGEDTNENKALSCRTCNVSIKSRWNPADVVGEDATRQELIDAVRNYVQNKRTELLIEICTFRKIAFQK